MSNSIIINLSFLLAQPTGISTYAANLIPYLRPLDPLLLTANAIKDFNYYPIPHNLTPAQGSIGHFRRLVWTQFFLPKIYQKLQANLLFSPVTEAPIYSQCRYVVMCHDLIPLRFPKTTSPLTNYFRYLVPQVLKQAEHIICNSEATAKDLTHFYGISPQKITPILLGYDVNNFSRLPQEKLDTIPQTPSYFLYLGRHDPYKNLHRLIEAFANLPQCTNYQLWLAGSTDPRYTPKLKQQAKELGISEQIKFLNYVSYQELPIIIQGAIALVFPTLWEGFGLPALEAMACGTPVITSNLASLPEITGDAAILINPDQVQEITSAMSEIATNNQLRSHLSHLSLIQASKFSWQKTAEATRQVLEQYY
ncbi:glycosyl transferase group 1 [Stanieria cyanosphaera PCC 7437]|uniref:Glycosyl transferase group 1 n=1 Tax=Stanieria cyanosphaera (strain ATCC 29371 / PCC 7437) TaxID=111780 RepID=K9XWP5_STAC7|nr:glycosyltransferase family 1 protein [Stanieria cyanosphaera]AFZ36077.1 glycosyl transferase group 1 [Stanieria cyanosphaera PCC 7437]